MSQPRSPSVRACRLVALAAGVLVAGWALLHVDGVSPPDSDESHHVLLGLKYHRDITALDPAALARHTLSTGRYPFLHGWFLSVLFLIGSPSLWIARASSAVLLGASAYLSARIVTRLRPGDHLAWGLLPAVFLALAPETFGNSVVCMLELPGTFLTLLTIGLYLRHDAAPTVRSGLSVGAAGVALLFVKYPYGAYVCAPLALAELVRHRRALRQLLAPSSWLTWAPPLLAIAVWLAIPRSRASVLGLLADAPGAVIVEAERDPFAIPHVQLELVAFYVRALVDSLSPGIVLGCAAMLGGIVATIRGGRIERTVLLGIVVWTTVTLTLSYRTFGVDRFLVPVVGAFFVLGAVGLADLARLARERLGRVGQLAVIGLVAMGLAEAGWRARALPDLARSVVETGSAESSTHVQLLGDLSTPSNVLVVGAWDQLSEGAIKTMFLLGAPDERFEALDVKAVRIDKVPAGTKRLDRWFDVESHWAPSVDESRRRLVVLAEPTPAAEAPFVSVDAFEQNVERARARISDEQGRLLQTRSTLLLRYEVWELPATE